jgi:choline dehydrogenase-like flavoprotein
VIVRGRDIPGDLNLGADVVVVGTGAGGSIALRELARAGLKVIGLEEGGANTYADFNQREDEMLPLLFQDMGGRTTSDLTIRVLQGRGLGGSTVHNTNLCKRTPDEILEDWARHYHVAGAMPKDLAPAFEQIERDLSVSQIPAALQNGNNAVLRRGVEALGWRGGMLKHNRIGCQQSGFCELGCAYDAKQNAAKVVIPQAVMAGAEVYTDAHVERIVTRGGDVGGVRGHLVGPNGDRRGELNVLARVVVLAGSAVGSAAIALASGLPDPHEQLGRGLRLHPGGVVAGKFDQPVNAVRGIPQSYECTEFLSFEERTPRRVWIVPAFAHPIGTASTLPGFGAAHMRAMRDFNNLSVLTAMVHDETSGRVKLDRDGRPSLDYELSVRDKEQLGLGLVACARILFAAGARSVTIPAIVPWHIDHVRELEGIDLRTTDPRTFPLTAVHPMGTMRMGEDPATAVVSSTGEHHQVRGLFVADGSLFPTSIGVPPQISIYAFALHLAKHIVAAAKRG